MNFDITAALNQLSQLARLVLPLLTVMGVAFGLFFIGKAGWLMIAGRDGRGVQDDVPFGAVAINLLAGGALVQFARSISNTTGLLAGAGTDVRAAMAYVASGASAPVVSLAMGAGMLWVGAIGAIGIFRGVLLWRGMADGSNRGGGDDLFWRGAWHILGGGVCFNIGFG